MFLNDSFAGCSHANARRRPAFQLLALRPDVPSKGSPAETRDDSRTRIKSPPVARRAKRRRRILEPEAEKEALARREQQQRKLFGRRCHFRRKFDDFGRKHYSAEHAGFCELAFRKPSASARPRDRKVRRKFEFRKSE